MNICEHIQLTHRKMSELSTTFFIKTLKDHSITTLPIFLKVAAITHFWMDAITHFWMDCSQIERNI